MRREGGFTLIEVLLASFIFMSVVTIAIGSFTSQITLQSTSEAQRNVQQTAQAIIEAISRDVRTNAQFAIDTASCTDADLPARHRLPGTVCGDRLRIGSPPNEREYRLQGDEIRLRQGGAGNDPLNDTNRVRVTGFRVQGIEPAPGLTTQPFLHIYLALETPPTGRQEEYASIEISTLITSRLYQKYAPTPTN